MAGWLAAILMIGSAGESRAHLSIIRQGDESRGVQEAGDEYGASVALGDFNGDGYMDVATGARGEAIGSNNDAGAVIVSFGSPLGVSHIGAQLLTQGSFGDSDQIGAQFGHTVKAGDFNNDGYDDLAIGGPYWDGGSILNCGRVWYARGSGSGLSAVFELLQEGAGGVSEADDYFGYSLAVGDFNGDGYDDLAVGGPGEDDDAGAVFQFLGSAFGPIENAGFFKQSTLGGTNERGDRFGFALAAGNMVVNIGTYDDLAVGSPNEGGAELSSGEVWLIRGSSTGLTSSQPYRYTAANFDVEQAGAAFGWALAAGRYFGGSTVGLAIGEPLRDTAGKSNAGRVIVARGGIVGLQMSSAIQVRQDATGETIEVGDQFGYVLGAGDLGVIDSAQELFVGAPDEMVGTTNEAGYASVLFGGANGPTGQYGWYGLYQTNLGDGIDLQARHGSSFASGVTDASGKATLVIGAPGDNGRRGMVHVVAPWRQVLGLGCKTSAVYDCQGSFVFSQKPFEEVCIASTTKIMTVLIACERSQLPVGHPQRVSLNAEYVVPDWVIDNVAGSRFEFENEERIRLEDLLYACMYPSGNDAAYAIADFLTGSDAVWVDHMNVVPEFINEMNARAQALGMTRSYFSNPAGLDLDGTHHSTAEDMLKLSRAAMANDIFRRVTSDLTHTWTRQWEGSSGPRSVLFTLNYGWLNGFRNWAPDATGLKPGQTPCGNKTACFAVPAPGHPEPALATTFHTTQGWNKVSEDGAGLMEIGLAECGFPQVFTFNGRKFKSWMPDVRSYVGVRTGGGFPIAEEMSELAIDLFRLGGVGSTSARLEVEHGMEAYFEPSQQFGFGLYDEFEELTGIEIRNVGATSARLRISLPNQTAYTIDLAPDGTHTIPPREAPYPEGFSWWIENQTGVTHGLPAYLHVKEGFAWDLSSIGAGPEPQFSTGIRRSIESDNLTVTVIGTDPVPGNLLHIALHEDGAPAGVEETPEELAGMARVTDVTFAPSPFSDQTTIRFALPLGGDVELGLFDAQGREVRRLSQSGLVSGSWSVHWDGRTTGGDPVPAGVYFYKLMLDGRAEADGKIVRIR